MIFIDSSKRSLKAILLRIANERSSIPIANFPQLKQCYDNIEILLNANHYFDSTLAYVVTQDH